MGKQIYLEKIKSLFDKSLVFDFNSIERIVDKTKEASYAKLVVYNLLKSGKIFKVRKGVYTKHSESYLAVFAFNPAYLGLQSALSFQGVSEQETIPVILTIKKVRRGIRNAIGSNILFSNIDKANFFGFDLQKEGSFYLPYSDIEKTIIDMIVFNQKISKDTIKKIKRKINKKRLEAYLGKYDQNIKRRALEKLKCNS